MIYYWGYDKPTTGGDYVNIEHVECLRKNQIGVSWVLPRGSETSSDAYKDSEKIRLDQLSLQEGDYLVIPENERRLMAFAMRQSSKFVIHNQNNFYLLNALRSLQELRVRNFVGMITASCNNAAFLNEVDASLKVDVIHPYIPGFFRAAAKKPCIAFSPRKSTVEAYALRATFHSLYPELQSIPWVEIKGLDRSEVANVLSQAAIYVAFGKLESICLSVLEAMASGCIVVGDHGGAGADFATDDNGLWSRSSDILKSAIALRHAVEIFSASGANNPLSNNAIETAKKFSYDNFERRLLNYWGPYL